MVFSVILAFQTVELVPNFSLLIHIGLILLMIFILNRTFFRPINRVIQARAKSKGGHSTEADEILKSVAEKQARYDAAMLEARSKGYEIIEKERGEAIARRQAELASVKQEVERTTEQERAELERQTVAARAALAQDAEQIAERISTNILRG